jgi:hypothetical protein
MSKPSNGIIAHGFISSIFLLYVEIAEMTTVSEEIPRYIAEKYHGT